MTDSLHRSVIEGKYLLQTHPQGINEADVLITGALLSRPTGQTNFAAENQALRTLAQNLTDEPQSMLKKLVHLALDLCRADTVGVSLLETTPDGESIFRWVAIAGALAALEQTTTPGKFSPCGTTLSCNQPQLYSHPERYFTYLHDLQFPIVEELLTPLCVNNRALGTLWMMSHSENRHFDAEDQRLMISLGSFAAAALQGIQKQPQTAATALSQSQEFNQQILDSSNDCIKVLDLEGRILFISRGGQASLSIQDITPFLNTPWVEFWQESERPRAIEAINRAKAGEVCTVQGYCPTLSGEPKWWDNKISPIRGANGQVERLLCISRDITERVRIENERQQAEEHLRESEQRLLAIFSQAAVGLSEISLDGHFQRVNQEICRILGRSPEEMLLATIADVTHPDDVPKSLEAFRKLIQTGEPVSFDKRYLRSDGTVIWANSNLTRIDDQQGRPQTVLVVTVDLSDRQQAEEKLRESEERYRAIVNQALTGVAYTGLDGKLTIVNQKYCDITGYSAAELSQLRMQEITHPEDLPRNLELFNRMLAEGTPFEIEKRYIRKDGSIVWVNNHVSVSCDHTGKPQSVIAIIVDISDRKRAEAAVADNLRDTQLLHALSARLLTDADIQVLYNEILTTAIALMRADAGSFQFLDDATQELLLLATQGFSPKMAGQFDRINTSFNTSCSIALATRERAFVDFDVSESDDPNGYRRIHVDAGLLSAQSTPLISRSGKLLGMVSTHWRTKHRPHERELRFLDLLARQAADLIEQRQAEAEREQLLTNERHYSKQLQGLTSAALAINSALSIEEVLRIITDQAASIIGAHQSVTSMTINQNWAQAINSIRLSDKYAAWRDYNEQSDGSGIYACVCHLNCSMRMTQAELEAHPRWKGFGKAADKHPPMRGWLAAPLVGRDGNNIGLIQLSDKYEGEFTASDESILVQLAQMASVAVENARLYEAEQQAREEAQAANRVKDEFLAVLSHELRSPLNPILGWSNLLLNKKLDAAKTTQALTTIQRNAKLQSELIEDLLDVSRILRGKLSLNVASVNLAATIRAAMETVRLAAEAKSIKLEARLAPDIGLVSGDSTRLQQVIWNLLSNAVKFTPTGGRVEVKLENYESSVLNSHLDELTQNSQSYAQITVSDTGQGITPDFLPYVFDYFRQADGATTRKFGGLGLGLAIVRHLVELHGGTVRVESPGEGQGATFTVRLPLMPTPLKPKLDERSRSVPLGVSPDQSLNLQGIKILVVDDDADSREFVAFLLEQQNAKVITATSAHEALLILTQAKPDILLSDIGMPDMDGYMLIQQVRNLAPEQGGQVSAIALTAYAGETDQQQVIAAGFQKHISKPIEPEVLLQAIADLIRPT